MPLATKNGAIIIKDGRAAENCGCCGKCPCRFFRAFDGSCKYYKYLTAYDNDLCSIDSVAPFVRGPLPGDTYFSGIDSSWSDDGYYKLEAIGCGNGLVVESERWYAIPGSNNATGVFGSGQRPGTHNVGKVIPVVPYPSGSVVAGRDPATVRNLGGCSTASRYFYIELSEEVTDPDELRECETGACCEGTTCTVKPACQCQGAGKVFKGVGTTCTPNPCNLCQCDAPLPDYIDVTFADFGLTYTRGTRPDMAGYESQLKQFVESLSLRFALTPQDSVPSQFALYRYTGGCYEVAPTPRTCVTIAGCGSVGDLLTRNDPSNGSLATKGTAKIFCDGRFECQMSLYTPPACWSQFPGNQQYRVLSYQLVGSVASGGLNTCAGSISSFTTSPADSNSSNPDSSIVVWVSDVFDLSLFTGTYVPSSAARINYAPHYANPLP
jgi:hypothetical protein